MVSGLKVEKQLYLRRMSGFSTFWFFNLQLTYKGFETTTYILISAVLIINKEILT